MTNNHLPHGWTKTTLGTAFKWGSGGTPLRGNARFYDGSIPWVIIGDLNDGVISDTQNSITEEGLENSSAKWVDKDSILLAMYGSIGKLGIAGRRLTTNQAIAFTKADPIEKMYLFYYLLSERGNLNRLGTGATQLNISQTIIKAYPFILAPLNEQKRIVRKIDELFPDLEAGIKELKVAQVELERYRASVLGAACLGKLVQTEADLAQSEKRKYESGTELLGRILKERQEKWSGKYKEPATPDIANLPALPEGWVWATIDMLAEAKLGKMLSEKVRRAGLTQMKYLRNENVRWGHVEMSDVYQMGFKKDEIDRYSVTAGDLIICEGGEPGRCAVYEHPEPVMYQKALHRVRFWGGLMLPQFGALCLELYAKWQKNMLPSMSQTTIKHLPLEKLKLVSLPLPPLAEQARILAEVDRRLSIADEIGDVLSANLQRADRLRQSILQRAFAGKLVPQDERDEPASALLEHISAKHVSATLQKRVISKTHGRSKAAKK